MILALDVDGTLFDGIGVDVGAVRAIEQAYDEGHTVIIVTGRPWRDLATIIGEILPFASVAVCEDGAVVVDCLTGAKRLLAEPPSPELVQTLHDLGVTGIVAGDVAIGMPVLYDVVAKAAVARFPGLHLVHNKNSVAIVPNGCDKGTGLREAIADFGLHDERVLAIGDASNDLPMFRIADVAVGVANADDAVRASGVALASASVGAGVAEAIATHIFGNDAPRSRGESRARRTEPDEPVTKAAH